jgi:hypothetical protein
MFRVSLWLKGYRYFTFYSLDFGFYILRFRLGRCSLVWDCPLSMRLDFLLQSL